MDIQRVKTFFKWCTIINGAMLVLSILVCTAGQDWVYTIHSKMFHVPRETLGVAIYLFLGLFKIVWIVFNLVPYLVLVIFEKK